MNNLKIMGILLCSILFFACSLSPDGMAKMAKVGHVEVWQTNGDFYVEYIHDLTGAKSSIRAEGTIDLTMIRTVIEAAVPKEHKLIKLEELCADRLKAVYRLEVQGDLRHKYSRPTKLMDCDVLGEASVAKATYNKEKFSIEMLKIRRYENYEMQRMPTVIYRD